MSYPDPDIPLYYPENCDYELYYQNELKNYQSAIYKTTSLDLKNKKPGMLPTISYLNERKCPIYVHNIRKDSSVYNHYNEKLTTTRKSMETEKPYSQAANKLVLDKLEETYWATWKPKKDSPNNFKPLGRMRNFDFPETKPLFHEHKVRGKDSNKPHGDVNDNIIKYFKAKRFESGSTTDSVGQNKAPIPHNPAAQNKPNFRRGRIAKQDSISQEIQTEVHCPVILEESKNEVKEVEKVASSLQQKVDESVEQSNNEETKPAKSLKGKGKRKSKSKSAKLGKVTAKHENGIVTEVENSASMSTFVEHKDSIEITKNKQEKTGSKEHFQQPKCIRLFRKSGLATGYIKGGTYPLKSCLRKEGSPRGNFRLGPPGSPLFVTSASFSNRKKNK